jgi:hypothetical protein
MTNIGAGRGSRSRSLELRSSARMLDLSPCPERRRVRLPACIEPTGAFASEGHFAPPFAQNYSTHVPSNFRANPLKTNDWCTHKVTQFFKAGHPVSTVSRVWEISRSHARWPFSERLRFSNRKLPLLEGGSTHRKQTTALRSNRKFSRVAPRSLATSHSVTSHCTRLPESRRSRPASDSLSGGII